MHDFTLEPPNDTDHPKKRLNRNERLMLSSQIIIDKVDREMPDGFKGDAHAFMCWVYKNPEFEVELRLKAAMSAVKFEKPTLASVKNEVTVRRSVAEMTDDELLALATTDCSTG